MFLFLDNEASTNASASQAMNVFTRLIYYMYERRLKKEIKNGPMPNHIGVILDGNRRFAKKYGRDSNWGHMMGYEKVRDMLDWCLNLKIKNLTLFVLSTENFNRPKEEVEGIFSLILQACEEIKNDPRIHQNRVHLKAIGRLSLLPEHIQQSIASLEQSTADYNDLYLNIAVAYGGRAEIIDSIKEIARKVKDGIGLNELDDG
nr:polyprenyl diphosphate synthase [Candidatus Sigynarchaeota archaeon]